MHDAAPAHSVVGRIQVLLYETDLSDPGEIAAKLLADLTVDERAEAFAEVAGWVVSLVMTRERRRTAEPSQAGRPSQTRAQRVAGWWREELRRRYRGVEGWRLLGEFTAADHIFAAKERRQRAAALAENAAWHERCAEAMRTASVACFEDLPAEVLVELLTSRSPE